MRLFAIVFAVLMIAPIDAHSSKEHIISLTISGYLISAEVAHTPHSRSRGLMYRKQMNENAGMLFIFPESGFHSMWMKDTYIPLSVAFIDEHGIILNIANMQPQTSITHTSSGMAKYALEMKRGWFSARKINTGAQVLGLNKAPPAW
ncbi:MAG: DUF192 domain-containing protein [Nitrosomonas sp. PRO4]|nr:DUF192 domain-containing protein [Nitrosomonas sp. PRO4]